MSELKQKRALGRGLSSLLDDISEEVNTSRSAPMTLENEERSTMMAPIDQVAPNPDQPRRYFDEDALAELADSIRQKGVIQPILVRPAPAGDGTYEIVAGERRWRAAQRARLHQVPIVVRELEDNDALELAIIENIQRADLNSMEEALAYKQLQDKYNYTQELLAKNLGKSRAHVANMLRLLNLPNDVQNLVRTGALTAGHARAVLTADDPSAFAQDVVKKQMSVRAAEKAAKSNKDSKAAHHFQAANAETRAIENELSSSLQMRVSIRQKGDSAGELSISYKSLDDLEELRDLLGGGSRSIFASG